MPRGGRRGAKFSGASVDVTFTVRDVARYSRRRLRNAAIANIGPAEH